MELRSSAAEKCSFVTDRRSPTPRNGYGEQKLYVPPHARGNDSKERKKGYGLGEEEKVEWRGREKAVERGNRNEELCTVDEFPGRQWKKKGKKNGKKMEATDKLPPSSMEKAQLMGNLSKLQQSIEKLQLKMEKLQSQPTAALGDNSSSRLAAAGAHCSSPLQQDNEYEVFQSFLARDCALPGYYSSETVEKRQKKRTGKLERMETRRWTPQAGHISETPTLRPNAEPCFRITMKDHQGNSHSVLVSKHDTAARVTKIFAQKMQFTDEDATTLRLFVEKELAKRIH